MPPRHVTLAYLPGFACLGPDCEDSCCQGWKVPVDEPHYRKLQARMTELGERKTFQERLIAPPGKRSAERFALIAQRPDGLCTFLDEARTCEIHRRHGEELLSDTCSMYPRRVSQVGERFEHAAAISCPEVARRALLVDGATDLVLGDASIGGRGVVTQQREPLVRSPYLGALDLVRGAMVALLRRREHPIRTRLFFLAELADRIGELVVAETEELAEGRLETVVAQTEADEVLAAMATRLRDAEVAPELGPAVVIQVLSARMKGPGPAKFRALFAAVLRGLARDGGGVTLAGDDVEGASVSASTLAAHLAARRDAREARFGDRLELCFENYARNGVMLDWFIDAPDLAVHVQHHLVRTAILRFLLILHPGLDAAAAEGPAALDRLTVEVFYLTARALDHAQEPVNAAVAEHLAGIPPLAAAVALLRV